MNNILKKVIEKFVKNSDEFDKAIQNGIDKISPKVQNEIKRITSKSIVTAKDNAVTILGIVALMYGLSSMFSGKKTISTLPELEEMARTINITYNEVHNTYNLYSTKGVQKYEKD